VVEQLPHIVLDMIPLLLMINYIRTLLMQGYETDPGSNTYNIITISLPELLQSSNKLKSTSNGQVWYKLPEIPYSSFSINHYQVYLITFTGGYTVEQPDQDKPVWE